MSQLPSPRRPAAGFHSLQPTSPRAFQLFERVPPGCELHRVHDGALCPHLRAGELVVVDMADREYQFGELYLVQWSTGHRSLRQVKKRKYFVDAAKTIEAEGVWFLALVRLTFLADGRIDSRSELFLSDGPLDPKYLPDYLAGRVIGIFEPPADDRLWPVTARRLGGVR